MSVKIIFKLKLTFSHIIITKVDTHDDRFPKAIVDIALQMCDLRALLYSCAKKDHF